MMPSSAARRGGGVDVVDAAAVRQHERHDVLLDAVLVDFEIVFLQVGDELALVVADDDVGRDEVDAAADDCPLEWLGALHRLVWAAGC